MVSYHQTYCSAVHSIQVQPRIRHKILPKKKKIQYLLKSGSCASLIKSVSMWFKSYPEAAAGRDWHIGADSMTSPSADLLIMKTRTFERLTEDNQRVQLLVTVNYCTLLYLTCSYEQEGLSCLSWILHWTLLWLMLMLVIKIKKIL